ncbi:I20RB protein, partial [Atractosteus spatula]|nr:I20RB protein [Atractosteus spatula]
MKHFLKWSPLPASFGLVSYSVQFQGEFELLYRNGSWEDVFECHLIAHSTCDMTDYIACNVDYNIRVQARKGGQRSDWASIRQLFNSRQTNLTTPTMTVTAAREFIRVTFAEIPKSIDVILNYWKKGKESAVFQKTITSEENPFHIVNIEEGVMYCLRALAFAESINKKSESTNPQCYFVPSPVPQWLLPTVLCTSVILALLLFISLRKYYSVLQSACCPKEPLPDVLLQDLLDYKVKTQHSSNRPSEVCDAILVLPAKEG